jgi:16S rRNA (guanine527-N7)-methyltransferase
MSVSRETRAVLETYLKLLMRWNQGINLIGHNTEQEAWDRHIEDSLQLVPYLADAPDPTADFGSGAGLPGIVISIATGRAVTLIESDRRKAAFLREAARVTRAPVAVINKRIEAVPALAAGTIIARAFAPLPRLLEFAVPHLHPGGQILLLKGRNAPQELTAAQGQWQMRVEAFPGSFVEGATILRLSEIRPV